MHHTVCLWVHHRTDTCGPTPSVGAEQLLVHTHLEYQPALAGRQCHLHNSMRSKLPLSYTFNASLARCNGCFEHDV